MNQVNKYIKRTNSTVHPTYLSVLVHQTFKFRVE